MRFLFWALILLEICLVAAPFLSRGIDSPKAARAWLAWRQNPTPEATRAWETERLRLKRGNLLADFILLGMLTLNTTAIVIVRRRAFRRPVITANLLC
jgi:hypothetical protein